MNPWPSDHVERFIELHGEGLSLSQLSLAMHDAFGVSYNRNACAGQVGRLRALGKIGPSKVKIVKRSPKPRMKVAVIPETPPPRETPAEPVQQESAQAPPSLDLTIYDLLDHHCRYPYGDRPPFLYCGQNAVEGVAYCPHHSRLCFGA